MTSPVPLSDTINIRKVLTSILFVAGLAELGYAVMNLSAMPVFLRDGMHYGETTVTSIGAAFLICEGVMKGPFGIIGDRIGRKWLMLAGPIITATTALITIIAQPHQWYVFALLRVMDGMGAAALWPSAFAMIADVVPIERRSRAMSLFNVTYLIGIAMGPFLGGMANDVTKAVLTRVNPTWMMTDPVAPLRASFILISFFFALTAAVAFLSIPNIRPIGEREPSELEKGFDFRSFADSLKRVPETLIMSFVTFFGVGMIMLLVKLFAMDEFKVSEMQYGGLLIVPALMIGAASVPLGSIGDRLGKVLAVRLGIGMCAFAMWALILIRSQFALVIGGSMIGVGFVIAFPSWMAHISNSCSASQRGAVMGAVGTAQGIGAMVGAPLGGYLYEHAHVHIAWLPWFQRRHVPFVGCAILLMVAWGLAMTVIREKTEPCS